MNPRLEAALARARAGEPVLPLWWTDDEGICRCPKDAACPSPGKHPLTKNGLHDGTTDPAAIRGWWERWPNADLGARTDRVARIDIDLVDVAEELAKDTALPLTTEVVRTPRGGLHIALAVEGPIDSQTRYLADGRKLGELKAARAHVVVPPSESGSRAYVRLSPDDVELVRANDPVQWLADLLPAFGFELASHQRNGRRDYEALAGTIFEGEGRHKALTSYAGRIWVKGMASETLAELHTETERHTSPFELPEPGEEEVTWVRDVVERAMER